ncbi:MAG: hypothetical protein WAR57_07605 [Candidatus Phosphoribacter sp.]
MTRRSTGLDYCSLIGTFIANALGVGNTSGIDWIKLVIQIVLAAIGVSLYAGRSARTV